MAIDHICQADDLELPYTLKFIMVALADRVDCSNEISIIPEKFAKFLGMSVELLADSLIQLRDLGYLIETNFIESIEHWHFDDECFLTWAVSEVHNG